MIRNLIWDVDGTLFDTYPAFSKAFKSALNELGQEIELDWITTQARVSIDHCVNALADHFHLEKDAISERYSHHYRTIAAQDQPPFNGVIEICKYIVNKGGENFYCHSPPHFRPNTIVGYLQYARVLLRLDYC